MSHLLATMNEEAAAEIKPASGPLPGIGCTVVFNCQLGYSRDGRTQLPAMVTRVRDDEDTLDLIVFYDAGDQNDEIRVPRTSTANPHRSWDFPAEIVHRNLQDRINEPGGLRGAIAELDKAIFGEYTRPNVSIIDIMQVFETRIRDMQAALDAAGVKVKPKKGK